MGKEGRGACCLAELLLVAKEGGQDERKRGFVRTGRQQLPTSRLERRREKDTSALFWKRALLALLHPLSAIPNAFEPQVRK